MYVYTITIAKMKIYNGIHGLMWAILRLNCVNFTYFPILHTLVQMLLKQPHQLVYFTHQFLH